MNSVSNGLYNARKNKSFSELYTVLDGLDPAVGDITAGRRFVKKDGSAGDASLNDLIRCAEQIVEQTLVENPETDFSTDQYAQKVLSKLVELDAQASGQVLTKRHAKIRRVWAQRLGNLVSGPKQKRLEGLRQRIAKSNTPEGEKISTLLLLRQIAGKNQKTEGLREVITTFCEADKETSVDMRGLVRGLDADQLALAKELSEQLQSQAYIKGVTCQDFKEVLNEALTQVSVIREADELVDKVLASSELKVEEESDGRVRKAIAGYRFDTAPARDRREFLLTSILSAEESELSQAMKVQEDLTFNKFGSGESILESDLTLALDLRSVQDGTQPVAKKALVMLGRIVDQREFQDTDIGNLKKAIEVNHTGEDGNLMMMINAFLEANEGQLEVCNLLIIALNPRGGEPEDELVRDLECAFQLCSIREDFENGVRVFDGPQMLLNRLIEESNSESYNEIAKDIVETLNATLGISENGFKADYFIEYVQSNI